MKSAAITSNYIAPDHMRFEIVERKGIGHPDTIADGIAESISIGFSRYCIQNFGAILNHWIDKTLISGALGVIEYGRGELETAFKLYVFGKMSRSFAGKRIDLSKIVMDAISDFLAVAVPLLDPKKHLEIILAQNDYSKNPRWMNPLSLEDLPNRTSPRANDTSVGIGHWPLSITEQLSLDIESFFYSDDLTPRFNYIGQDIKIMTVRNGKSIDVTMAVPFLARHVPDENFYLMKRSEIQEQIIYHTQNFLGAEYKINVTINNNDRLTEKDRSKRKGYYFLVLGSALDDGEVGVVGRGNAACGVISPMRRTSMEAPYGKNPVYHVGKVYTYLANKLARAIAEKFGAHASVSIMSKMGNKLSHPGNIIIELSKQVPESTVNHLVQEEFGRECWSDEIINSKYFIPTPGNLSQARV